MHKAYLKNTEDASIRSDTMSAPTVREAKQAAKENYQTLYNANQNWQTKYPTFNALLEVSVYMVE